MDAQQVLFEISQGFTQIMSMDIGEQINRTLKKIGSFNGDDRCYIFLFDESGSRMNNTHEWCAPGIDPQIAKLQNIPLEIFPWWIGKLADLECIHVSDVAGMPMEAQAEKDILMEQNIQAVLALPIVKENRLVGYIGFDSVRQKKTWPDSSVSMLRVTANIIGNALRQKQILSALTMSETYYRTIFESTGTPSMIIDEDYRITDMNRCWTSVFGYKKEDSLGQSSTEMVPPEYLDMISSYHMRRKADPDDVPKEYSMDMYDSCGKRRKCKAFVDIIPGTMRSVVSVVDMTETFQLSRSLRALGQVNQMVLHTKDEKTMLDEVCRTIVETGGYCCAWAGCIEKNGEQATGIRITSVFGDVRLTAKKNKVFDLKDASLELEAIRTTRALVVRELSVDQRPVLFSVEAIQQGIQSLAVLPIFHPGSPVQGVLSVYSRSGEILDKEELRLLEDMVSNISFGISALRTQSERDASLVRLKVSSDNLDMLMRQTVKALKSVVQTRDPYTAEHQEKVAKLSLAIAKQMGLSEERCNEVNFAASIHDIGKINVPSDILNKPGKLSIYEFELVKGHCRSGYDILCNIDFPWSIAQIILQHHERMDGSGYPEGLAGGEILLAARILSVADVFDAMSSHRPYRPSLGLDYALKELGANRGQLYDREVVDACFSVIESGFDLD
jgi:PAS domain S-box-containing protein